VTNEGKEMRVGKALEDAGLSDDDFIVVDPENPIPNPHLGPLHRRVSTTFDEGLVQEEVDPEAMAYWFTEPAQGWNTEKRRLRKATVVANEDFVNVRHQNAAAEGRRALTDLRPGDILHGTVERQMLYHGLQIDVGAESDGLIAVAELDAWNALGAAAPDVGDVIEVVVHAIRDDPIFRFPLQLVPADPVLKSRLPLPESHLAPLDLRDVPLTEYASVASRSGREWSPIKVVVPLANENLSRNNTEEWLSEEELQELDDIAAGFA